MGESKLLLALFCNKILTKSEQGVVVVVISWRSGCVTLTVTLQLYRGGGCAEKAPTRAFSWLKAATTAFTFKTLLRLTLAAAVELQRYRQSNTTRSPRNHYNNNALFRFRLDKLSYQQLASH